MSCVLRRSSCSRRSWICKLSFVEVTSVETWTLLRLVFMTSRSVACLFSFEFIAVMTFIISNNLCWMSGQQLLSGHDGEGVGFGVTAFTKASLLCRRKRNRTLHKDGDIVSTCVRPTFNSPFVCLNNLHVERTQPLSAPSVIASICNIIFVVMCVQRVSKNVLLRCMISQSFLNVITLLMCICAEEHFQW